MATIPPSVSNSVELANLTDPNINTKAYQQGYISLPFVEPSLGIPTGNTLTEEGSAYYFPVFGINSNYSLSRKFTGNDSLVLKNKRLGINTPNPQFSVDVTGTVRASNATLTTLSATNIVPSSGNNITFFAPDAIQFNSNVNITGQTTVTNLTANNLLTTNFNAVCAEFTDIIINTVVLTGAQINNAVSIVGGVSATNAQILSSTTTNTLIANTVRTNTLSARTATITNTLSVGGDLYATNVFGRIQIDPTSPFSYNNDNQLTFNRNIDIHVGVKPTDPFSTDDVNVPRTTTGQFSATGFDLEGFVLRPFFKNIQAAVNYAAVNGLVGRVYNIFIYDDIVEGERRPNGGTTLTDESGKYSGLNFITGNLSATFFSTEWLQLSAPALYNAGLRGGHFIWPINPAAPMAGEYRTLRVSNLNFEIIRLMGMTEIGSQINASGNKFYTTWSVFDRPPRNISFRSYVCANPSLPFGTLGSQPSAWTTLKTEAYAFNRPFVIFQPAQCVVETTNLAFEFDSNAYDSTGYFLQQGTSVSYNNTICLYGNSMYAYGAISTFDSTCSHYVGGSFRLDPFYLTVTNWQRINGYFNGTYSDSFGPPIWGPAGQIFPGWGLAVIGNPPGRPPTNIWYGGIPDTGIFRISDRSQFRMVDYGTVRNIGREAQHLVSVIFDGQFNTPSIFYASNGASFFITDSFFKTNTFALSGRSVNLNNTGVNPSYIAEYFTPDPANRRHVQFLQYDGSFSTAAWYLPGIRSWEFLPTTPFGTSDNTKTNFFTVSTGAIRPEYVFTSSTTVNMSGSVQVVGRINQLEGQFTRGGNVPQNNKLTVCAPSDLRPYNTPGFFTLTSPNNSQTYTLNYYASATR